MKHKRHKSKLRDFISNLMEERSEEEIFSAEVNFNAFLDTVEAISRRIEFEKKNKLDTMDN